MKRFVSYLYSIYNNQKMHNAGFARMELRAERNRVDIHLKENGYAGKTGTVYLFIRKQKNIQGISIGNITFRGNQADFRYEQAEENIGQTPWQIMQMNGILIVMDDRPAFLSQWDEQPVDTSHFEVWNVDKLEDESSLPESQLEKDEFIQAPEPKKENISEDALANDISRKTTEEALANDVSRKTAEEALANETVIQETVKQTDAPAEQHKDEGVNVNKKPVDIQTAELQPQPQTQWNQNWRYMLKAYPVLNQFADKYSVLCVRIEIKDMRLLPEKYWSMVNNSFLLHGFFNYRYLVFGRIGQNWFVGIPGIYQNQEHVMASIFGFPDFLPQKEKNERGEQPGYWYRILEF